ncbi:AAA family ATPase [Streptomyces sp. NPDC054834]
MPLAAGAGRGAVVRRLLVVDESGSVSRLHVRVAAELAGVSERTVWRWLAEGRAGQIEGRSRRGGFAVSDALWAVLAEEGGNVSALHRRLEQARAEGSLGKCGVTRVPSASTLQRVVRRDLLAGRVLEVARPARGRVVADRYDQVLADLRLTRSAGGPPVLDGVEDSAVQPVVDPDREGDGTGRSGVRLFVPGARLVSTAAVASVAEAVGHTVAARGIVCVFGDTGLGKTVAVQQALHLLPSRVPVWRAVVGVRPGLPQVRSSLLEAVGLSAGSLAHRSNAADSALAQALRQPGVLFLDDAQRLSPPLLDYLRLLWDEPGTAAALVLCGAGAERVIARAPALRSRVLTWHQTPALEQARLIETLRLFHEVWETADPADVVWADSTVAHGNFRTWAKITSHVYAPVRRQKSPLVDRSLVEQACARLGPYP